MPTTDDYINYCLDQLRAFSALKVRKMFGECMIYIDQLPAILVCDNTPYIKMHDSVKPLMMDAAVGYPYPGAKLHYILDVDDASQTYQVLQALLPYLSIPKPKKRK
jgi:TfoX/Sxy family transcriptional regulator of competence genes